MWGWYTPTLFSGTPPPLSLYQKLAGPQYHEKPPGFGPSNRLRKPRCPVRRIVVNRAAGTRVAFSLTKTPQYSDIILTSKMCFCCTKTLARGAPPGPLRSGKRNHGEATARRRGAAAAHGGRAGDGGRGGGTTGAGPRCAPLGGSVPAPLRAGAAGADGSGAALGGGGATGAEPDRGESQSNGAGDELRRGGPGGNPGGGRAGE